MPGPPRTYATNAARQRAYRERCRGAALGKRTAAKILEQPRRGNAPRTARWRALVQAAGRLLHTAVTEMQAYCDQRTESWRGGERGENFLEQLEALQEAKEAVEEWER